MSIVGFAARNHPQQLSLRGSLDEVDDRGTAPELFDPLDERFGFTVDVAAAQHNAKVARFYSIDDDGLAQSWAGEIVWCNPPYSDIRPWLAKAWAEPTATIVMLLPANRTEQGWWQEYIEPHRDRAGSRLTVEFLRGRRRFIRAGRTAIGPNERPPFGVCVIVFRAIA